MRGNNNNDEKKNQNNFIDSIKQNTIIEGLDKTANKLHDSITRSFLRKEITGFEANTAKYVPKSLFNLSGFLDKVFKVETLIDIATNKKEPLDQKIISDGPRLFPGMLGASGELWNKAYDENVGKPYNLPIRGLGFSPNQLTGLTSDFNNTESNPLQTKGFLNGDSSNNQFNNNTSYLNGDNSTNLMPLTNTLYGYANENSYLGYPTPAFGAEVSKAGQFQEIKLETPSLLETLGLPDMHKENSSFYEFGSNGVNIKDSNRLNVFDKDLSNLSYDTGSSNSILVNNGSSGVNSSPSFINNSFETASSNSSNSEGLNTIGSAIAALLTTGIPLTATIAVSCIGLGGLGIFFIFLL